LRAAGLEQADGDIALFLSLGSFDSLTSMLSDRVEAQT
jgi:hypothetical protein